MLVTHFKEIKDKLYNHLTYTQNWKKENIRESNITQNDCDIVDKFNLNISQVLLQLSEHLSRRGTISAEHAQKEDYLLFKQSLYAKFLVIEREAYEAYLKLSEYSDNSFIVKIAKYLHVMVEESINPDIAILSEQYEATEAGANPSHYWAIVIDYPSLSYCEIEIPGTKIKGIGKNQADAEIDVTDKLRRNLENGIAKPSNLCYGQIEAEKRMAEERIKSHGDCSIYLPNVTITKINARF